ncbi:hypothetical protein [Amycolatopsis sp. H20-H5]|uniref:hypothetical protein n=1 Tax=Amycolatopsis sp. H20-H5 TaxID=3046309 RepID=UPI002DB9AA1B|nr:hypothetical protein [Amycolatopsis sp. H20-H5]MEC3980501.1 hypothetical protein [Amycolatopsis sp. H20-H5]
MLSLWSSGTAVGSGHISIHACTPSDADGVANLVELGELTVDHALSADLLVGVVDHRVVAVLAADGTLATDPFFPAAETCELLLLRARQLGRSLRRAEFGVVVARMLRSWYTRGWIG